MFYMYRIIAKVEETFLLLFTFFSTWTNKMNSATPIVYFSVYFSTGGNISDKILFSKKLVNTRLVLQKQIFPKINAKVSLEQKK